jgi:hypothetical protein
VESGRGPSESGPSLDVVALAPPPPALVCVGGTFYGLFAATFDALPLFSPQDAFFCTWTRFTGVVALAHFFLAVPLGLLMANVLLWLIPSARRALDGAEARVGNSFSKANAGLVKFFLLTVLLLVPIQLLAAGSAVCMSQTAIQYRAHSLAAPTVYPLSQIEKVRPSCWRNRDWHVGLVVAMSDGATFDLIGQVPRRLSASPAQILDLMKGKPWDYSEIDRGCPQYLRKLITAGG